MWGVFVDCSNSAVEHMYSVAGIFIQVYMPIMYNVCMSRVPVHIFDCT